MFMACARTKLDSCTQYLLQYMNLNEGKGLEPRTGSLTTMYSCLYVKHVHILTIPVGSTVYFLVFSFQLSNCLNRFTKPSTLSYCSLLSVHKVILNSMCPLSWIYIAASQLHWKCVRMNAVCTCDSVTWDLIVWIPFVPQFTHNCYKLTELSLIQGSTQKGKQFIILPSWFLSSTYAMQRCVNRFRFPIHDRGINICWPLNKLNGDKIRHWTSQL